MLHKYVKVKFQPIVTSILLLNLTSNIESSYCLENSIQTQSIITSTPINSCKFIPKQLFKQSASIEDDNIIEVNNSLKDLQGKRFVNVKHIFESIQSIKHVGFNCT